MSTKLLDTLDQKIEGYKARIAEGEENAKAKRKALTGDDAPEVGTDEFKSLTDELSGIYKGVDTDRDALEGLKSQRVTIARTVGAPLTPEADGKASHGASAFDAEQFAEALRKAQAKGGVPSIGERITTGEQYKALQEAGLLVSTGRLGHEALGKALSRTEFKTLISRGSDSAGAFIDARGPQLLPFEPIAQDPIDLLSLVSTIEVSTDSVKYVVEKTINHNVKIVPDPTTAEPIGSGDPAVTPEQAGLKPESEYTYGVQTANVETLAHFLPIHKNQLADVPQLRGILDNQMRYGVRLTLQSEITSGVGGADHLTGILNTNGIVEHALGSDPFVDGIHKIITAIRLGYNEPTAIAINPLDWETIRLSKDANGNYHFGPPSQAGASTLWGKPVVVTQTVPQGQPIVADWRFAELYLREGVSLLASDSHADFFRRNLIALLAEMRAGFGLRRPQAFGTFER